MNIYESKRYTEEIKQIAKQIPHKECTVLVTGATGMIGSCIVDAILMANKLYCNHIKIIALGRNREKLLTRFKYADSELISFIAQDIVEPLDTDDSIDFIIHTASNADPVAYSLFPAETLLTNIYGASNMLAYCKDHRSTRLLLTSTFEVYGKIEGQDTYKEDDSGEVDLNAVRSCYPESKRCAEILMRCFYKEYGSDCVIVRLSSIYGPTMTNSDSKAHAQFIRNALAGEDIVLKSKGSQKRTYCYLMDAVSGIFTVLFKGESGEAYNISNESSITTISGLAQTVANICGTKVVFNIPDDVESKGFSRPQNCVLDNRKLKSLGWDGAYTLERGLNSTIEILREISR